MKLKAKIEIEYEVNPEDYTFSASGVKKELILEFERKVFLATLDIMCTNEPTITVEIC